MPPCHIGLIIRSNKSTCLVKISITRGRHPSGASSGSPSGLLCGAPPRLHPMSPRIQARMLQEQRPHCNVVLRVGPTRVHRPNALLRAHIADQVARLQLVPRNFDARPHVEDAVHPSSRDLHALPSMLHHEPYGLGTQPLCQRARLHWVQAEGGEGSQARGGLQALQRCTLWRAASSAAAVAAVGDVLQLKRCAVDVQWVEERPQCDDWASGAAILDTWWVGMFCDCSYVIARMWLLVVGGGYLSCVQWIQCACLYFAVCISHIECACPVCISTHTKNIPGRTRHRTTSRPRPSCPPQ